MPDISPNRLMNFDYGIDTIVYARKDEHPAAFLNGAT